MQPPQPKGAYYLILEQINDVDFINVQYYNNDPNPILLPAACQDHYTTLVMQLFQGDASKVRISILSINIFFSFFFTQTPYGSHSPTALFASFR